MYIRKQNSLWAEGDVFRMKVLNEHENGKKAVTKILSGVDDITINRSNKNRTSKKDEMELVSFDSMFLLLNCFCVNMHCVVYILPIVCFTV